MAFPQEVRDRLEQQGVGTFGVNMFISSAAILPVGPGPYLSIIETGGSGSAKTHNNTGTERPTAQILTRAKTAEAARLMSVNAYGALGGENGLYNVILSGTPYISLVARQNTTDIGFDADKREQFSFNIDAEKAPSSVYVPPGPPTSGPVPFQLIEELGGDYNAFLSIAVSDQYPAGTTFDALVPGSWPVVLNRTALYVGNYVFECNARVSDVGARAKVALFDLTNAPNAPLAEIVFSTSELIGERKRSAPFAIPLTDTLFGAKPTINSTIIQPAAWGCRILRV